MILKDFSTEKVNFETKKILIPLELNSLNDGINNFDNFIIYVNKKEKIFGRMVIYDRICDHNGGKLISKGNEIICPLHNWRFNPTKGEYINANFKKKPLYDGKIKNNLNLVINTKIRKINTDWV